MTSTVLFDASGVSDYWLAPHGLPGRFTSRAGLAHALVREAVSEGPVRTCLDMIRKEAFGR
ncbi:hypothetical protein [Streptomyces roseochromogenus]|uniref:Uncharacterized protein n=1 Tax=Streptomyces roseochromogenus subsp. oscitans DS 12.976 TaxID=1352936 RepID=V6KVK3_STRRC|nr:hypothetical protein [Streptomyces roseochromogenus]EST36165.1 hypothetical protein M878_03415 [Streptomyces roseochromogenus subsp. oscitans DS 12.976]